MRAVSDTSLRRLVALWLLALLVLGGYLRLHGVNEYYYSLDELAHVEISKGATVGDVMQFSRYETHPPYAQILRHWLVGISDAPWFLRGESVAWGLLTILVYYVLGKELGGRLAGCAAAYLIAFGFGNIEQSQVVRNYELLALCLGVACLFYHAYLRDRKQGALWGYGAGMLLALMVHYSAVFALICMGGMGFILLWRQGGPRRALYLWTAVNAALALYFCYVYVTQVRFNAYQTQFALNEKIAAESPEYNGLGFRIALFIAYIPAVVSFFLHSSFTDQLDSPSVLLFVGAMVWLYSVKALRPFFWESLLSLLLGAGLLAADIYPYAFRPGGRHAMWIMAYVILPVALFAGYAISWLLARVPKNIGAHWKMAGALALLVLGMAINPARGFFEDPREYQITNAEREKMRMFLGTLGPDDVMLIGGLNALYFLPSGTNYYAILASAKPADWYYTYRNGDLRMLFYYPIHDSSFNMRDFVARLGHAGELKGARTIWFFHTLYDTAPINTPECDALPKKIFSFPPYETLAAGKDLPRVEITGVSLDVLMRDVIAKDGRFSHCL